jgi:tetratricopeptide (TPR) repeat protein
MIKLSMMVVTIVAVALVLVITSCIDRDVRIVPIDIGEDCIEPLPPGESARVFPEMGDRTYPIVTTGSYATEAQNYFDQGMNLLYAFNHPEAIHSFAQAAAYDPTAPMPYWGIAMAAGPDINTGATPECLQLADSVVQEAIRKAQDRRLQDTATESERELRYAMALSERYPRNSDGTVWYDSSAYAMEMERLASDFPDDLDAATLYAAALMNITPWQWWNRNNSTDTIEPTREIGTAITQLESVLSRDSRHMGANHYYIHAYEASPTPEQALSSARLLPALARAAGHIVHMPSHIYRRTGDHAKATAANYEAVFADLAYISQAPATARYPLHYLSHNLHFLSISLSIEGREGEALAAAQYLFQNTSDFSSDDYNPKHNQTLVQAKDDYFFTVPILVSARFHAWEDLEFFEVEEAAFDQPSDSLPFTEAMWEYANTLKYLAVNVNQVTTPDSLGQLEQFWAAVRDAPPNLQYGNNDASKLFRIANLVLVARAAEALGGDAFTDFIGGVKQAMGSIPTLNPDTASLTGNISIWSRAVEIEDSLAYNEPPDWYYPVRESLGAAYYRQGNYAGAEAVFRNDLTINEGNGRSLFGLIESIGQVEDTRCMRTDAPEELVALCSKFREAWKNATEELSLLTM